MLSPVRERMLTEAVGGCTHILTHTLSKATAAGECVVSLVATESMMMGGVMRSAENVLSRACGANLVIPNPLDL